MSLYKLNDCKLLAAEHPDTFLIPSQKDINNLKVGDICKLIFLNDNADAKEFLSERMWVTITKKESDNFTGTLSSDPAFILNIKFDDVIEFNSKHIASIY